MKNKIIVLIFVLLIFAIFIPVVSFASQEDLGYDLNEYTN